MNRVFDRVSNFLIKKKVIIIVLFLVFLIGVLPWMNYMNYYYSSLSVSFDSNFGYTLSNYYYIRESLGSSGRQYYIIERFTFDLMWPLVYGAFLFLMATQINSKNLKNVVFYMIGFSVIFDFLENIAAVVFVLCYPDSCNLLIYILMVFTILKWALLIVSAILLVRTISIQKIKSHQ